MATGPRTGKRSGAGKHLSRGSCSHRPLGRSPRERHPGQVSCRSGHRHCRAPGPYRRPGSPPPAPAYTGGRGLIMNHGMSELGATLEGSDSTVHFTKEEIKAQTVKSLAQGQIANKSGGTTEAQASDSIPNTLCCLLHEGNQGRWTLYTCGRGQESSRCAFLSPRSCVLFHTQPLPSLPRPPPPTFSLPW